MGNAPNRTRLWDKDLNLMWDSETSELTLDEYLKAELDHARRAGAEGRIVAHITSDDGSIETTDPDNG